jgi:glycosyltransferase involved in cell wall biosynthesis
MKIAIVAPSPVPYAAGAPDRLWQALAAQFTASGHDAELIKLPTRSNDLAALVRGYAAFAQLDLGSFDMAVSGQRPAWALVHPNHACYLVDAPRFTWSMSTPAADGVAEGAAIEKVRQLVRHRAPTRTALPEFFARWDELLAAAPARAVFDLSGAFALETLHWLDRVALSPASVARHVAPSPEVAGEARSFLGARHVVMCEGAPDAAALARELLRPREAAPAARADGRRKLVVASTFPIHPPRHGGQNRTFHLFRSLAPEFETVIVSLAAAAEPVFSGEIAPGVREVRIPRSEAHELREQQVAAEVGTSLADVLMPELHELTPAYRAAIEREAVDASAVVASHPYVHPIVRGLGLPLWYEAQDFELHMKASLYSGKPRGEELTRIVSTMEGTCAREAEAILCASPDDADDLVEEYGVDRARILDVPNGTDGERIAFTAPAARAALRERLAIGPTPLAFFMGSGHWPNIEAVRRIFEFASGMPSVAFIVVGSVCYAFDRRLMPGNVLFLGEVDEVTRDLCLEACHVALNPMEHGSGTNIKMLDYFAAGIPVITTPHGARGLRVNGEEECLVRAIGAFPKAIAEILGAGAGEAAARAGD